jgi:hypothetical protein
MKATPNRIGAFLYNFDRSIASLLFGTEQETISSEVGRIAIGAGKADGWTPRYGWQARMAVALAHWLDSTPRIWGYNHCSVAIEHADLLDKADNGQEK